MELQFKRLRDNQNIDLVPYVQDFIKQYPETKIFIGCDSQNSGKYTNYALVIVLHQPNKGGHVLYHKVKVNRIPLSVKTTKTWGGKEHVIEVSRLWNEVEYSIQVAEFMKLNGLPKPDFIDVDLNDNPRYKSNTILKSAMGYIEAMGYVPRCKPNAMSASYVADAICK